MTASEALKSVTNYPIPRRTLQRIAVVRDFSIDSEIYAIDMVQQNYRLAEADVYNFLVSAPNISEGGVSFSLSQAERDHFKKMAEAVYLEFGEQTVSRFGYKGESL